MPGIRIDNQIFRLANGLTLIVHEDRKAPVVAVNIWYHVGSKNEKRGKTGFAHLFEHLMFNGSQNFDDDFFKVFEGIGATDMNGTTDYDRTNYFANVPAANLDPALWMESDRMGNLLPAITQAKLDEQRGVVQNELRQYENQPYGKLEGIIARNSFPSDHPYSWEVGGSIADLDTATLADIQEWFRLYYNPANAVLALAGDIDSRTALARVEHFFGAILSFSPVSRHQVWIPRLRGSIRQKTEVRAPQALLIKIWSIPPWGSREGNELRLIGDVLAGGKNSRLYKRLVYEEQLATEVEAQADLREIAGQFTIQVTLRPGASIGRVEERLDEELDRLLREGISAGELEKVKVQYQALVLRRSERVGGFGGKSDLLAAGMVYRGDADYHQINWGHVETASAAGLQETAKAWLNEDYYLLEVHPFPAYSAAVPTVDRSRLPDVQEAPGVRFPPLQHASLANGLKIVLAERRGLPLVHFSLVNRGGFAADPLSLPGTASLTAAVLDEGTPARDALKIAVELELLGAELSVQAQLDAAVASLSALSVNLSASLELFADVVLHPLFPEKEFLRLRQEQLAAISQEQAQPAAVALRLLPGFLYGPEHPYGRPLTGSGTADSLGRLTREDLRLFYESWFCPDRSWLLVAGDTSMDEILPRLEDLFSEWSGLGRGIPDIPRVTEPPRPAVYLVDRPDAAQSLIVAGQLMPPKHNPQEEWIETMNNILGENFTSRLNMNLREDKHWSYGVRSRIPDARGQRPLIIQAPVQTDKTAAAMIEIRKEIEGIRGSVPVSDEELKRTVNYQILRLPGSWETQKQIVATLQRLIVFGLPVDYYQSYVQKVSAIQARDIARIAAEWLSPERLTWIVVGDRQKVEADIRSLDLGEFQIVTAI